MGGREHHKASRPAARGGFTLLEPMANAPAGLDGAIHADKDGQFGLAGDY